MDLSDWFPNLAHIASYFPVLAGPIAPSPGCTSVLLNESNQSQHENLISCVLALVMFSTAYLFSSLTSPQAVSTRIAAVFTSPDVC